MDGLILKESPIPRPIILGKIWSDILDEKEAEMFSPPDAESALGRRFFRVDQRVTLGVDSARWLEPIVGRFFQFRKDLGPSNGRVNEPVLRRGGLVLKMTPVSRV